MGVGAALPSLEKKKRKKIKKNKTGETVIPRRRPVGEDVPNPEDGVGTSIPSKEAFDSQGAAEESVPFALQPDHPTQQAEMDSPRASPVHQMSRGEADQAPVSLPSPHHSSPAPSRPTTKEKESPHLDQRPTPINLMLSDPFFGGSKDAENPDLDGMAQEAISSLLRAGCLFAKLSQDSASADEVEELRQKAERYHLATLEAYSERDRLLTQVTAQVIKLNNLGIEINHREEDLLAYEGKVDELEEELDDMRKEVEARAEVIAASKAACDAKDKELASLRSDLAASDEALATVRTQLEAKDRAITEAETRASSEARALRTKLEIKVVAEAVEEHGRGFFLAKAQVQHLYEGLDLSGMGAFKRVTLEGLVGPDDPPGFSAEYFLAAENARREEENINAV